MLRAGTGAVPATPAAQLPRPGGQQPALQPSHQCALPPEPRGQANGQLAQQGQQHFVQQVPLHVQHPQQFSAQPGAAGLQAAAEGHKQEEEEWEEEEEEEQWADEQAAAGQPHHGQAQEWEEQGERAEEQPEAGHYAQQQWEEEEEHWAEEEATAGLQQYPSSGQHWEERGQATAAAGQQPHQTQPSWADEQEEEEWEDYEEQEWDGEEGKEIGAAIGSRLGGGAAGAPGSGSSAATGRWQAPGSGAAAAPAPPACRHLVLCNVAGGRLRPQRQDVRRAFERFGPVTAGVLEILMAWVAWAPESAALLHAAALHARLGVGKASCCPV